MVPSLGLPPCLLAQWGTVILSPNRLNVFGHRQSHLSAVSLWTRWALVAVEPLPALPGHKSQKVALNCELLVFILNPANQGVPDLNEYNMFHCSINDLNNLLSCVHKYTKCLLDDHNDFIRLFFPVLNRYAAGREKYQAWPGDNEPVKVHGLNRHHTSSDL